jgi:hypothetical protein
MTPLSLAIQGGHYEIVQILLRHKCDVSHECFSLNMAITRGHLEIVKLLMEHGANPDLANGWGKTSWEMLRLPEQTEFEEVMKNTKPVEKKVEGRAKGFTPPVTTLAALIERLPVSDTRRKKAEFTVIKL